MSDSSIGRRNTGNSVDLQRQISVSPVKYTGVGREYPFMAEHKLIRSNSIDRQDNFDNVGDKIRQQTEKINKLKQSLKTMRESKKLINDIAIDVTKKWKKCQEEMEKFKKKPVTKRVKSKSKRKSKKPSKRRPPFGKYGPPIHDNIFLGGKRKKNNISSIYKMGSCSANSEENFASVPLSGGRRRRRRSRRRRPRRTKKRKSKSRKRRRTVRKRRRRRR